MSTELTDKTMVVISRSGDFWVKADQAESLMQLKSAEPSGFTKLDGCMVTFSSIDSILTAEKYEAYNIKRRGGWQCKYQQWHEFKQTCAHGWRT